ncbi:MAG: sulfatase-like hydrolase/transferase, partial [Candidatus Latescibacteria bacterium]|nr:sulfatase-like hydrolase/transferase [Candidatus Latescibacterota bacterium]
MPNRPNIIIFQTDDMGFSDLGCYGGEIQTPNLDALAQNGLRFTNFYTSPKCFPSRACLLTGQYAQKVGLGRKPRTFKNCVTLGEALRPAGYRTLMTGKWHAEETPYQRGFDRHFGLTDGCCDSFNPGIEIKSGRNRRWAIDEKEFLPYIPDDPNFYTT